MYNPLHCIVCEREGLSLNPLYAVPPVCGCSFSSLVHIDCISLLSEVAFRCHTCKTGLPDIYRNGLKYEKYESKEGFIIERIYDRNDVLWGDYKVWWKEGRVREISFFIKGRREGLMRRFHAQGTRAEECTFRHGRKNGLCIKWYPSGLQLSETIYVDDLENGEQIELHPDGKTIKVKCTYANGKLEGNFVEYYENGAIAKRCIYTQGITRGRMKYYREDGLEIVERKEEEGNYTKKETVLSMFRDIIGGIFNPRSEF